VPVAGFFSTASTALNYRPCLGCMLQARRNSTAAPAKNHSPGDDDRFPLQPIDKIQYARRRLPVVGFFPVTRSAIHQTVSLTTPFS